MGVRYMKYYSSKLVVFKDLLEDHLASNHFAAFVSAVEILCPNTDTFVLGPFFLSLLNTGNNVQLYQSGRQILVSFC